jgi:hypothetical protein
MQLSRVAIAAVFFVVGALLVIPMLLRDSNPSQAVSATPSVSDSATPTNSGKPSRTPTHKPSPTHTTKRPSQRPTTHRPVAPTPTVTSAVPLRVSIGTVRCPGRSVLVTVDNQGKQTEDYAITTDGAISVADRISAGVTRKSTLTLREGHATTISVTWHNVPVKTLDRTPHCAHHTPGTALPHTGPDSGLIFARIATGIAAMLTGVIIFWYGRLWPGRREKMFGDDAK